MKATLSLPRRAKYVDYLAAEQNSDSRHEFIDGVIVAMAGGSDEHNVIALRFAGLSTARVPRECRSYTPDQRFWTAKLNLITMACSIFMKTIDELIQ